MKAKDFFCLSNIEAPEIELITAKDLKNAEDRTLLYGYDCNRNTFHVYLKNGEIEVVNYRSDSEVKPVKILSNQDYVPNKRVYPEYSDFEFCRLLIERYVDIPFLPFDNEVTILTTYFGKTL